MSNKDVIENLEFCLYKGICTKCSFSEEESMLSCRTLLEDCRNALKNSVEVVRCKDCRYWQYNNGGYPHEECRWGRWGNEEIPDEDDFCSYGERKDS